MRDIKKMLSEVTAEAPIGIVMMLISVAIGLLVLAVILTIGPVVGYNIESSNGVPWNTATSNTAAANAWSNNNTAILNGTEIWAQDTPLLGSAAIVVIAGIIISVLLGAFILRKPG